MIMMILMVMVMKIMMMVVVMVMIVMMMVMILTDLMPLNLFSYKSTPVVNLVLKMHYIHCRAS